MGHALTLCTLALASCARQNQTMLRRVVRFWKMADIKSIKRSLNKGWSNRVTVWRPRSFVRQPWQSVGVLGLGIAAAPHLTMRQTVSRRQPTIWRPLRKIHTKFEHFRDIVLFSKGASSFDTRTCMCARPPGDAAVWFAHPSVCSRRTAALAGWAHMFAPGGGGTTYRVKEDAAMHDRLIE
jgi:hypothetical protein